MCQFVSILSAGISERIYLEPLFKWAELPRGIIGLPNLAADLVVPL